MTGCDRKDTATPALGASLARKKPERPRLLTPEKATVGRQLVTVQRHLSRLGMVSVDRRLSDALVVLQLPIREHK
jgi:hypothetical protein